MPASPLDKKHPSMRSVQIDARVLAAAVALPTLWLLWSVSAGAGASAHASAHDDGATVKSRRSKTYRISNIPLQYDRHAARAWLQRVLETDLCLYSLAVDAVKPTTQVATIDFQQPPAALRDGAQWMIPTPDEPTPFIVIDTTFLGITTLAAPVEPTTDIIALSGLGGHAYGSFARGSYMWLRDAVPDDIHGARVMVYGYDTSLRESSSFQDLEALGRSLCGTLSAIRHGRLTPKVFIGHSLGGLVVKQAIIQMSQSPKISDILDVVTGILFFGVPSHGMNIESLLPMVRGQPNELLLLTLGPESQQLREQSAHFRQILPSSVELASFYETKMSPTARQDHHGIWKMDGPERILVDSRSARHEHNGDAFAVDALNRSHSQMVRFDPHDEAYQRVLSRLQHMVDWPSRLDLDQKNMRFLLQLFTQDAAFNPPPKPTPHRVNLDYYLRMYDQHVINQWPLDDNFACGPDSEGRFLLHTFVAQISRGPRIITHVLEKGANPAQVDMSGRTAVQIAMDDSRVDIAWVLLTWWWQHRSV